MSHDSDVTHQAGLESFPAPREIALALLLFCTLAVIFTWPILARFDNWGIQDWDQHLFYQGAPRTMLLQYGQFPLWNPYYGGGMPMLANPQSTFLSPVWIFVLIFGAVRGVKLEIVFYLVAGLLGVYLLGRGHKLSRGAAIASSAVFMLGGMYASVLATGMSTLATIGLIPWIVLFYLRAFNDIRYALLSGAVCVMMYFGGGLHPLIITLIFLTLHASLSVLQREASLLQTLKIGATLGLFALCLGAVKVLPSAELMSQKPRFIDDYSGYSLGSLAYGLLARDQSLAAILHLPTDQPGFLAGFSYGMDENGLYVGIMPMVLLLVGLATSSRRLSTWVLSLVILVWLGFGNRAPVSLWQAVRWLPILNQMRVAQRFRFVFMLIVALLVGFGFEAVRGRIALGRRTGWLAAVFEYACLTIVIADMVVVNSVLWRESFQIPPQPITPSGDFRQIERLPAYNRFSQAPPAAGEHLTEADDTNLYYAWGAVYPAFLANLGTIHDQDPLRLPRRAVPATSEGYRGEVYFAETEGTVQIQYWSPARLVLGVHALGPGYIVVNQNYFPGWHAVCNSACTVAPIDGLLAVRVLPTDNHVELYYLPLSFVVGAALSGTTLVLTLIALWLTRPRIKRLSSEQYTSA